MSLYTLINGAGAAQTLPPSVIVRPVPFSESSNLQLLGSTPLNPAIPITPPRSQVFQLLATCSAGNVSATVQIYGSNDGVHWLPYMTISAGSGASPQNAGASGQVPYAFFGALVTAISGTNAQATVTMSC